MSSENIILHDLIGIKFANGGRDKATGFDCWGLVLEVFRRFGYDLPDYKVSCEARPEIDGTIQQNKPFWKKIELGELSVPALLVIRFNSPNLCNHTGVYIGNGRFIHTRQRTGVVIEDIESPVWRRVIEGFYIPKGEALECQK